MCQLLCVLGYRKLWIFCFCFLVARSHWLAGIPAEKFTLRTLTQLHRLRSHREHFLQKRWWTSPSPEPRVQKRDKTSSEREVIRKSYMKQTQFETKNTQRKATLHRNVQESCAKGCVNLSAFKLCCSVSSDDLSATRLQAWPAARESKLTSSQTKSSRR